MKIIRATLAAWFTLGAIVVASHAAHADEYCKADAAQRVAEITETLAQNPENFDYVRGLVQERNFLLDAFGLTLDVSGYDAEGEVTR